MGFPKQRLSALSALLAFCLVTAHGAAIQECNSHLNNQLLIAEEGKISRLNPSNTADLETLVLSPSVISLDYSYARNSLYFSDLTTRQVYALKDKSSKAKVIVSKQQQNWLPISSAVDDVTSKLYVADAFAGTVNIFDLKNDNHGIVIGSNLTQPRRLVLDTLEGYLFVLDKFQILRTDIDGSNSRAIYTEYTSADDILGELPPELKDLAEKLVGSQDTSEEFKTPVKVSDIVLDTEQRRIYWVNVYTRKIESANYEGGDRKVIFHEEKGQGVAESLFSTLTLLDGKLYWADDVTQSVYEIDLNSGENSSRVLLSGVKVQAIKAVSCSQYQQKKQNPCANDNGQCQQLCVLARDFFYNFRCACNVGYELAQDGKSCKRVEDFLLFVQDDYLKGRSLSADSEASADVINPSQFRIGSSAQVDYDAVDGEVFFTSSFPNDQLHRASLVSGEQTQLLPDFLSKSVRFIAYDWVAKNLYYVTYYYADMNSLSVLNVRDPSYSRVLVRHLPRLVRGIAVHPNRGYVYFARLDDDRSVKSSISRMNSDGSEVKLIVEIPDVSVDALAVDHSEDRVYWAESKRVGGGNRPRWQVRVRHSNLDGSEVQELSSRVGLVRSITIDQDHVYLTVDGQEIVRLDKKTPSKSEVVIKSEEPNSLADAKLFSRKIQSTSAGHPCASHDCRKFCFAVPQADGNLKGVCGCAYGEKLAEDGRSCVDNRQEEPPFVPCKYTSFKCNAKTAAPVA